MAIPNSLFITECPRDAMQGIKEFIPTELKIKYLNSLMECGFQRLDFGSFVSPKAIPQLQDTAEVLDSLNPSNTELLAIVANTRGAEQAARFDRIGFIGFPFSVSETFQQRNTNKSQAQAWEEVLSMAEIANNAGQNLLVYLSMGFGNPYGDDWSPEIVVEWAHKLAEAGIHDIALADTVGTSTPETITQIFSALITALPQTRITAHLHSTPEEAASKVESAIKAGCLRFDTALNGYGGCPMATNKLTGNLATEVLLSEAVSNAVRHTVNFEKLRQAQAIASEIFDYYH